MTETLLQMIAAPAVSWEATIDKMSSSERDDLLREVEAVACRAALFSGYVGQRYGYGCGDQGHKHAAKEANRRLVKVRKALGFSYPERGCVPF